MKEFGCHLGPGFMVIGIYLFFCNGSGFLRSRKILLHPPFPKGEKVEGIFQRIPQSSPPFEKGRTGGISG
jgi:hypothetical protein